jgi:hypothetical protein
MKFVIIQFLRLRLSDCLPCFVELLQGKQAGGEIFV